jgi:DNA-damage-inducible protein J
MTLRGKSQNDIDKRKMRGECIIMAQTTICIRVDADLKKDFEKFCDSIGMSMSTAINIFIKKSVGEQRIPFEITAKNYVEK